MPSLRPPRWRAPQPCVRRALAASFAGCVLSLLAAAPVAARPDGDGSVSHGHHGRPAPPAQAVAAEHRSPHAGPPASQPGNPAPGPPRLEPAAPPQRLDPDPAPVPETAAPVEAPVVTAVPPAPAPVPPATEAVAAPAGPTPSPSPIAATSRAPAALAPPVPAAPRPATDPGFPRFPSGDGSAAATEAARSSAALVLLAGLMALFLVAEGRFTRRDPKLLQAPVEQEERDFR